MRHTRTLLASLAALAIPSVASAQHLTDIALVVVDDRIETGVFENGGVTAGERVFVAEFGAEGFPDFTADPGFDNFTGTFAPSTSIGFNIVDANRFWNGSDFEVAPNTISIEFFTLGPIFTPANPGETEAGFAIPVNSAGRWHRHLDYYLDPPAVDGVYLLTLELYTTDSSISHSEPFHVVFDRNATQQELDDAVAFLLAEPSACIADVTTDGTSNGTPDGAVTLSDFSFYLSLWGAGDTAADLTTDGTSNGVPDGAVTLSDFSFYLSLWGAGCP